MSQPPSNIRVFATFPETAFFSGEGFSCILTFKNVAEPSPSSSTTSLAPLEEMKTGSRIISPKYAGPEWMAEAGRSASEGVPVSPQARGPSPHGRSMSTTGLTEQHIPRSRSIRRNHERTLSEIVSSEPVESAKFEKQNPFEEDNTISSNGVKQLQIDTTVSAASALEVSPAGVDTASPSSSPLPQISKLDLHSTVEDDASSETSSVGQSKAQNSSQANLFNIFSPRSSLDIRDPGLDFLSSRQQSQSRRLFRSPLGPTSKGDRQWTEVLMMGYVQITGNFMIDEALIHANEFDDVKSKSVVGGKSGGGVVGLDTRRAASWTGLGQLGTFNFGSLFGGAQPSSLAEMRDRAASKTIPILSTPPSILFVDIRLLPGESKSFSYSFKLPPNLPPSHRGRALRISYSLVVTTQRPGKSRQHLSTAEIPFRLFSNLDANGHQPKYDLKSPIILLRDEAKTSAIKEGEVPLALHLDRPQIARRSSTYSDRPIESSEEEFMDFVDHLLSSLGKAPMSASDPYFLNIPRTPSPNPSRDSFKQLSCRNAIDVVIQKGFISGTGSNAKAGVFEIGKNGVTLATLTLPRTIFKIGEMIDGVIDFVDGVINCYQVRSTLESAEDIDPVVSVRSRSSVYRATRRVHGSKTQFATFARRLSFAFEIPSSIAPTFETSAIRHHWSIRLEFMTSLSPEPNSESEMQIPQPLPSLLQPGETDEKASIYTAVESLYCESFDCHVPILVLPTNHEIPEDRVGLTGVVV